MAIELKEYCGYSSRDITTQDISALNISEAAESSDINDDVTLVDIEGIHSAPFATRNFTRYTKECLKRSAKYWTQPYRRPLIKFHNEKDGQIIGRVLNAEYMMKSQVPDSSALMFTVTVPKEPDSSDVKTGLLETVSIGVIAHDVRCSICGQNLAEEGPCDHERGQVYDGEICYWDVYEMEPKELSYVIVPSDSYAKNKKVYTAKSVVPPKITESIDDTIGGKIPLDEQEKKELLDQIAELKAKAEESDAAHEIATKEATAKIEELQQKIDEAVKALEQEKEAAVTKEEELVAAKAEVESAKVAQETADAQAIEAKEAYRNLLIDNVNFARKLAGKTELEESAVAKRTNESLHDSLFDLKEELTSEVPGTIPNPGLPNLEEKANQQHVEVKESGEEEKIDLSATLEDLFSKVIN